MLIIGVEIEKTGPAGIVAADNCPLYCYSLANIIASLFKRYNLFLGHSLDGSRTSQKEGDSYNKGRCSFHSLTSSQP